jgi:hypothetical protein
MRKHNLLRLGMVLLVVTGSVVLLCWTAPARRINRTSFDMIREGMSKDAVVAILGCLPGNYCLGPARIILVRDATGVTYVTPDALSRTGAEPLEPPKPQWNTWIASGGCIRVTFTNDDRVETTDFYEVEVDGIFDRLRNWLGGA